MKIRTMFKEDIERSINGVIKVNQNEESVVEQEVREYVVTSELRGHFERFFSNYNKSFSAPEENIGVWIQGFFGSGKSHFLKMLSYLLENKSANGKSTVAYFKDKFADNPLAFAEIESAANHPTETILFNIDIESGTKKDTDSLKKTFQKVFYSHRGFYGENLQTAELELFLSDEGKYDDFKKQYQAATNREWVADRANLKFRKDAVIKCLTSVLGWSVEAAREWIGGQENVGSISGFVDKVKKYLLTKPADFRLLFMIDEVGQYIGTDGDLLLNLQSLVEEFGTKCGGKVWVVCTGQSALDDLALKIRSDEFSKIQARFSTRLTLSSTSVNEVIQKRLLQKKPEAAKELAATYEGNENSLRNLFTFKDAKSHIHGFKSSAEFVDMFPFVPYQFSLLQKVFTEVRQHGNSGKHLSDGARSMLSGFQEAAKKLLEKDQTALAPFYSFYDSIDNVLDDAIRDAIRKCADNVGKSKIEAQDVDVYKLLYLMYYLDDVPSNLDNIAILMADNIDTDTRALKDRLRGSLARLENDNYIGQVGGIYNFLTNEEQDIQKDITKTDVSTTDVSEEIKNIFFDEIFTDSKIRFMERDFPFNKKCDGSFKGAMLSDITLEIISEATDPNKRNSLSLTSVSSNGFAIINLADDTSYYDSLEKSLKIKKYLLKRNRSGESEMTQKILATQQEKSRTLRRDGVERIKTAVRKGKFFILGDASFTPKSGLSEDQIVHSAMEQLISGIYTKYDLIEKHAKSESDIIAFNDCLAGSEPNTYAITEMADFLSDQLRQNHTVSVVDLQQHFTKKPYGWTELDVALIVASLLKQQRITVKKSGTNLHFGNHALVSALTKRAEIASTTVKLRQNIEPQKLRKMRDTIREIFTRDIPTDEDNCVAVALNLCKEKIEAFDKLLSNYNTRAYPDKPVLENAKKLLQSICEQEGDNTAVVEQINTVANYLCDACEDAQKVDEFFKTQREMFDKGLLAIEKYRDDQPYLETSPEACGALEAIREITNTTGKSFNYSKIPDLPKLAEKLRRIHSDMLSEKKAQFAEVLKNTQTEVEQNCIGKINCDEIRAKAAEAFARAGENAKNSERIAMVDAAITQLGNLAESLVWQLKDEAQKKFVAAPKSATFPTTRLTSEAEIDAYVERIRSALKSLLKDADGIDIK